MHWRVALRIQKTEFEIEVEKDFLSFFKNKLTSKLVFELSDAFVEFQR